METLGDDLVLLAILPNGVIGAAPKLRFGLSGSELIRLAALRRVGIERDRIVVLDQAPTGDVFLDEALASMHDSPTALAWVAGSQDELVRRYLERLAAAGTIRLERRKALGFVAVDGWTVLDAGRTQAASAAVTGAPDEATDAAVRAAADASVRASIYATAQAVIRTGADTALHANGGSGHAGGHH